MNQVKEIEQKAQIVILFKSIGFCIGALILTIAGTIILLRYFAVKFIENDLENLTQRVTQELTYKDGKWDTSLYASDPQTPHPNGSSGFSSTLYIISSDGFIIERNAPIFGLLDTSDFNHLMAFQNPQTITNITNEQWRVLSKPITDKGKIIGVIMVSIYNPDRFIQDSTDEKLRSNISKIEKKFIIKNGNINTSDIDIRNIDFDISFEIVTTFNKVLLNNGRMPTYIDKSYVYNELQNSNNIREYKNPADKKTYLIVSKTILDSEQNPVGIVLTGKPITFMRDILNAALPYIVLITVLTSAAMMYLMSRLLSIEIRKILQHHDEAKKTKNLPSKIEFNKHTGVLAIDDKQISIPFDSNQYYLLKTVFSKSKKRYEVDELLEAFGHEASAENWRKVYDAMNLVNKKVEPFMPIKLIELRDKTYQLNPQLTSIIHA